MLRALLGVAAVSALRPTRVGDVFRVEERAPGAGSGGGVEFVAIDDEYRREVGWFEVVPGGLHAKIRGEPEGIERALGQHLMVSPEARRRGVATQLLEAAAARVAEWRLSELILTAVKDHAPAYALYRKLGFEEVDADLAKDSASVLMRKFVETPTAAE